MNSMKPNPILFDSKPNPERHPDRLRVMAALRGLEAKPFSDCTVLDIGCGTGVDLIHFAASAPLSSFYGIDISVDHLNVGRQMISDMNLKNVKLVEQDIKSFNSPIEKYDYILCHGVFSWVNQDIQSSILKTITNCLDTNGLAYISFNCLPGWSTRSLVRKLLLHFDDPQSEALARVQSARERMKSIAARLEESQTPHTQALHAEILACASQSAAFIYHELLGSNSSSFYLNDFLLKASQEKLQYLGDGRPSKMRILDNEIENQKLRQDLGLEDHKMEFEEQVWDFLLPPSIRGCILCHEDHNLLRDIDISVIKKMNLTSPLVPLEEEPKLTDSSTEIFTDAREYNLEINNPYIKVALMILVKNWPVPTTFSQLVADTQAVFEDLSDEENNLVSNLANTFCQYFFLNLVDFTFEPSEIAHSPTENPKVFELARLQAKMGYDWVSNPRFEFIRIEELDRQILMLLDGQKSLSDCVIKLLELVDDGSITLEAIDPENASATPEELITEQLFLSVSFYCESALLIE